MNDSWRKIIKQYADGRKTCNCGDAYYSPVGEGSIGGVPKTDMMVCAYGCSSAQLTARDYIADRILGVENPREPVQKKW